MSRTGIGIRLAMLAALAVVGGVAPRVCAKKEKTPRLDVPYLPTELEAVDQMLKLAKVTSKDYLFDLGCGDGRIVVLAAKKYKARGFGVDLDPKRIRESRQNATKAGVTDRAKFKQADIMVTDVSQASVVTLFLLEKVNIWVRPRLFAQLKPGVRVVSNGFHMRDWKADKTLRHPKAYGGVIYFWIMPAPVGGTWRWKTKASGKEIANTLALKQEFQAVKGAVSFPGAGDVPVTEASLFGKEFRFAVTIRMAKEQVRIVYRGAADGDAIRGTQEWLGGSSSGTYPWFAQRDRVDLAGRWQIRAPSPRRAGGTLHIQRKADSLQATFVRDSNRKKELPLPALYVWGSSIRFEVPSGLTPLVFRGSLGADAGGGTVSRGPGGRKAEWSAKRIPEAKGGTISHAVTLRAPGDV